MIKRSKKEDFAVVISEKDARVLDNPVEDSPVVCELPKGKRVRIISKPNKNFYGVGISNSVIGFIRKDDVNLIKTE